MEAMSVETPIIQEEPRARAGFDRETMAGSRRATRRLPAEQVNGCPNFTIECEKHRKSKLDTITVRVQQSKTENLKFLVDTSRDFDC
jgi:hypothetical protein